MHGLNTDFRGSITDYAEYLFGPCLIFYNKDAGLYDSFFEKEPSDIFFDNAIHSVIIHDYKYRSSYQE